MKHLPTVTVTFNKQTNLYGFMYDDETGTMINHDGYQNSDAALGAAWKILKTFYVMEYVETYQ